MNIEKYTTIARSHSIVDLRIIAVKDLVYDPRVILKCRWGCDAVKRQGIRCSDQGLSVEERRAALFSYNEALFLHGHNSRDITLACLALERELFLEGHYLAFALRACNFCLDCAVKNNRDCTNPDKVRPCEGIFGIDIFRTARNLGLPIDVLKEKDEVQNRYGCVLIQ